MRILFLTIGLIWMFNCTAQRIPINKHAKLDTLFLAVRFNESIPAEIQGQYAKHTQAAIDRFNRQEKRKMTVVNNPEAPDRTLFLDIDDVHITTKSQQFWTCAISVIGLAALPTVLVLAETGAVAAFAVWPYNKVRSKLYTSDDLNQGK